MTVDTTTTDINSITSITTDHANYIDYSDYNSIKPYWQWDGNNYLNNYIYNYNHQYFVVPNIYNIPSHIVLTEGTIVYATDTNTLYIYSNGRFESFESINPVQSRYTVSSGYTTTNTLNNKQKKLVEENNLIMLYFF